MERCPLSSAGVAPAGQKGLTIEYLPPRTSSFGNGNLRYLIESAIVPRILGLPSRQSCRDGFEQTTGFVSQNSPIPGSFGNVAPKTRFSARRRGELAENKLHSTELGSFRKKHSSFDRTGRRGASPTNACR